MMTYLVGSILVFFITRYFAKKSNDWNEVTYPVAFLYALGSWISVIFILAILIESIITKD
jgi:hypothetical protein